MNMISNVLTTGDFDKILDDYSGRQVTHTPVVQTVSNISGQETLTDGTTKTIKVHFLRTAQSWDFEKAGFLEKGDAVMLSKHADGVKKDDKITADSQVFRVREAYNVPGVFDSTGSSTSFVYTSCNLFLIE